MTNNIMRFVTFVAFVTVGLWASGDLSFLAHEFGEAIAHFIVLMLIVALGVLFITIIEGIGHDD